MCKKLEGKNAYGDRVSPIYERIDGHGIGKYSKRNECYINERDVNHAYFCANIISRKRAMDRDVFL